MIAALAVLLALSASHGSDAPYSQTVQASAPLAAGGEIEIDDEYGDVRVAHGAAGIVRLDAVKKADNQSDLSATDVHVDAVQGAVKVTTSFPSAWSWFHHSNASVDFDVQVPPGTKVILRLKYGDGVVAGIDGAVDAESRYGDIHVDGSSGPQALSTEYGDVKLSMAADARVADITMHTTYGDIDLTLPSSATPRVHAQTRFGDVDDDFSQNATAGPSVDVQTTFGDVTIRKGT